MCGHCSSTGYFTDSSKPYESSYQVKVTRACCWQWALEEWKGPLSKRAYGLNDSSWIVPVQVKIHRILTVRRFHARRDCSKKSSKREKVCIHHGAFHPTATRQAECLMKPLHSSLKHPDCVDLLSGFAHRSTFSLSLSHCIRTIGSSRTSSRSLLR